MGKIKSKHPTIWRYKLGKIKSKHPYKNCESCRHADVHSSKYLTCDIRAGDICGNREQKFPSWKPNLAGLGKKLPTPTLEEEFLTEKDMEV